MEAAWGDAPLGCLMLADGDGIRHVIRIGSIQLLSDTDPCRDSTTAVVAGRPLMIPQPLDDVLAQISMAGGGVTAVSRRGRR